MSELRIAVVGGGGFMGKMHSLAWGMVPVAGDLSVVVRKQVLVDATDERAADAARARGWAESSSDWRAVVERSDIDVVDIVTHVGMHEEVAAAAIQAGKHVFCEKPLTVDAAAASRLAAMARDAGVVNQVGFCYRHTAALAYAHELISSGALGEPMQFRGSYLQDGLFTDSDWLFSAEAIGASDDVGSHLVDTAQYLVGDIAAVVGTLAVSMPKLIALGDIKPPAVDHAGQTPKDDGSMFVARFANGAIGTFATSFVSRGARNRLWFEIDCTRGALRFNWNHRDQLELAEGSGAEQPHFKTVNMGAEHPNTMWAEGGMGSGPLETHVTQLTNFVTAIADGRQSSPSFTDAARVQAVTNAVARSLETGGWVAPDLDSTRIS